MGHIEINFIYKKNTVNVQLNIADNFLILNIIYFIIFILL